MMPSRSHTGTPAGLEGLRHFTVSTIAGSAARMMARSRASISPRQPPREAIFASISSDADASAMLTPPPAPHRETGPARSFPLDRPRRLAGIIVDHPVDALHLVDDPGRDMGEEGAVEGVDVGGHAVQ